MEQNPVKEPPLDDASFRPKEEKERKKTLLLKSEQSQAEEPDKHEESDEQERPEEQEVPREETPLRHYGPQTRHYSIQMHKDGPQTRMHTCSIVPCGLNLIRMFRQMEIP